MDYAEYQELYRQGGIGYPLPIPPHKKGSPPPGTTGAHRPEGPTDEEYETFANMYEQGNLGLRMSQGVIGIDVDTYAKVTSKGDTIHKQGIDTIRDLEDKLGELPVTWISSSRDNYLESGIRYFRIEEGTRLQANIKPDVEIIQSHHRYALVEPSIFEDRPYLWHSPEGVTRDSDVYPVIEDLPFLPEKWVDFLSEGTVFKAKSKSKIKDFIPTISVTESKAEEIYMAAKERFYDTGEGQGYNDALYGFSKDCLRYYLSMGTEESEAYDHLCADVQSHPAYDTWGALNYQDIQTMHSARSEPGELWNILPDPIAFSPYNTTVSKLPVRVLKHLWKDKMVNRSTGILFGEGGVGKSSLYIKVAAKLSKGTLPGHFDGKPGCTLVYTKEDDKESVFFPRVTASGADPRFILWPKREFISFPSGADSLREELAKLNGWCRLVVFDPLDQYIDGGLDGNKNKDVASVFAVLNSIASEFDITILGIKHKNKATESSSYHRVSGSTAYVDHSRFVLEAGPTEDFDATGHYSIGLIKSNTMRKDVPALLYTIGTDTYKDNIPESDCFGQEGSTSYVQFVGDSEFSQEENSWKRIKSEKDKREGKADEEKQTKKGDARLWMVQCIAKSGGIATNAQLKTARTVSQSAPAETTLERAMREYVQEEPRRKSANIYRLDGVWVTELIDTKGELPDGTPLPGAVGSAMMNPHAKKMLSEYAGPYEDAVKIYVEKAANAV